MKRLSSIILVAFVGFIAVHAQSPHGKSLKVDCAQCHNPRGWTIHRDSISFDHNTTAFRLEGTHATVNCRDCHASLIFDEVQSQCLSCHTDVHSMSVGNDCARCHTPDNWLVSNIPEIHEQNGFPLVGTHSNLNCIDCHKSETNLRFDRLGNDCFNCHNDDYASTENPNHAAAGYSTNCIECHDPFGTGWGGNIIHDFFPLVQGHDIEDCKRCHTSNNYTDASPVCNTCHMDNYNATSNPNHTTASISTDCANCHTIASWVPATFDHGFYPIEGAHIPIANDCNKCHNGNYTNTPNTCAGCHLTDYNNTTEPNHSANQFSIDCAQCHTQDAWAPASFDHNTVYPLHGAHATIANDCNRCHSAGYTNTPNTCVGCHQTDYNSTNNPNHSSAGFSTDCAGCHNETSWTPATFDHDAQFFPIYSGKHREAWNLCTDCHIGGNYATFSCIDCHEHNNQNDLNDKHSGVSNYSYNSNACYTCHPDGRE